MANYQHVENINGEAIIEFQSTVPCKWKKKRRINICIALIFIKNGAPDRNRTCAPGSGGQCSIL